MKGLFIMLAIIFALGVLLMVLVFVSLKTQKKKNKVALMRNFVLSALVVAIGVTVGVGISTKYGHYTYYVMSGEILDNMFYQGKLSQIDYQNSLKGVCEVRRLESSTNNWFYTYTSTEVVY